MIRLPAFCLALLCLITTATATSFATVPGTISDGYTYRDGYWWWGTTPYIRTLVTRAGYWSCGYYYPGTSYYSYSATTYTPQAPITYQTPNWRSKLLDIAAQRDKVEGQIRLNQFEQAYFSQSVKDLGLDGNFRWPGYGTIPAGYGGPHINQYGIAMPYGIEGNITNYGANASTLYGYSYNNLAQIYGDTNLNQLFQQSAQLVQQAQSLGGAANQQFQQNVGVEGSNRAKVAEVIARAQMAKVIIDSLQSGPAITQQGFTFKISPQGPVQIDNSKVDANTRLLLAKQWEKDAVDRCAFCHSASNKKGGFDVAAYPSMSPEAKQAVWARLTTDDPGKVMPRALNGGPGARSTQEQLRLWFLN